MDRLWTPWRMEYILEDKEGICPLCAMEQAKDDEACHIPHRAEHNFIILNRYPYNNGHLMIVPYEHVSSLEDLDDDTLLEMMQLVRSSVQALRETMKPDGFNIGANLGTAAGAGINDHLHMHVVPRWSGDTNFMTVMGGTRVLPELLRQTCSRFGMELKRLLQQEADAEKADEPQAP